MEEMLLMAYVELHRASRNDVWFLDSGCSNHMCGDRSMFCDLNDGFKQIVNLGNIMKMSVAEKGYVQLCLNGVTYIISGVF